MKTTGHISTTSRTESRSIYKNVGVATKCPIHLKVWKCPSCIFMYYALYLSITVMMVCSVKQPDSIVQAISLTFVVSQRSMCFYFTYNFTSCIYFSLRKSRSTIVGTFFCLVNYPEVTRKIQEEVYRVLGDKQPKIEDRARMPYTEAVILEGLRIISSVRLSGYRMASQDIEFDGMTIPKGSLV